MVNIDHRPVLIVIAGPNGSGKTTITTKILQHEWMENAIYINPDQIAKDKYGDWNSIEAIMQSVKFCEQLREECLQQRKSLIFETVLSADDKIDYIRRAHDAGFFIRIFFVSTNHPSINASRIARRVMKGGHDVPISKVISRYFKSILNCRRVSMIADRTYIYDNSIDNQEARLIFRMVDGKVFKRYVNDLPDWVHTIIS
ncbi:MAG: zeta toxin family protein [Bacteroidaceae bacterium]|nr:zeta toxin family protein [Bacteroidaceae bacterium]